MRLIDANNISFHCNYDGDCTGDIEDCKECANYICDFRDIQEQPTAYDIGKVVEELQERQKEYLAGFGVHNNDEMYGVACGLGDAIKIVKQGGISDDVCEWNQRKGGVGLGTYNISCCDKTLEMPISTARGLKYCTYCGKKIKVVE